MLYASGKWTGRSPFIHLRWAPCAGTPTTTKPKATLDRERVLGEVVQGKVLWEGGKSPHNPNQLRIRITQWRTPRLHDALSGEPRGVRGNVWEGWRESVVRYVVATDSLGGTGAHTRTIWAAKEARSPHNDRYGMRYEKDGTLPRCLAQARRGSDSAKYGVWMKLNP